MNKPEWMPENPNPPADRLLTKQEFRELQPSMSGVETIVLQAQDRKSVKAVIEEIEKQANICEHAKCEFSNKCDSYIHIECLWWQQFKERILK